MKISEQAYLDFGNRLWGMSGVLFLVACWIKDYPLWAKILSGVVLCYFFIFGNERFAKGYRKIF
jgi:hypothetical protein